MSGYPSLNEIEIAWRKSGTGVCIIVEGETELDDAWFYKQWFDYRAREISFFPQDGYEKVELAVAELRERLGPKQVYGIIDRDFASDEEVSYSSAPSNGILRTPKYTLENYLLDPDCWFDYIRPYTRRQPKSGWDSVEDTQMTIARFYELCLPLAACNWTLFVARKQDYAAFKSLPDTDKQYREHPKALENLGDLTSHFQRIQTEMGLVDLDLSQQYSDHLTKLQGATSETLDTIVSGKYVLKLLQEQFPLRVSGKQAWDDVLGAYIDKCPDPPADLVNLVDLILADAHA